MKLGLASNELPEKRTSSVVEWVSHAATWQIVVFGLFLYIGPVVVFTLIEFISLLLERPLVYEGKNPAQLIELLYFNFITIITIGYGDLQPIGFGRVLSVAEGILGVGILGLFVAALTAKFLSPSPNSIVFSRYGYYCTDEERFLLIFVNTTNTYMVNVDMTSYFKLGGDWGVREAIRTPVLTTSVQTFYLDKEPIDNIVKLLREGDVFRFGLSGSLGLSTYSTGVQYHAHEIIVIPNRDELTSYKGFHSPDFRSLDISEMFHYRPKHSLTLAEYVSRTHGQKSE